MDCCESEYLIVKLGFLLYSDLVDKNTEKVYIATSLLISIRLCHMLSLSMVSIDLIFHDREEGFLDES